MVSTFMFTQPACFPILEQSTAQRPPARGLPGGTRLGERLSSSSRGHVPASRSAHGVLSTAESQHTGFQEGHWLMVSNLCSWPWVHTYVHMVAGAKPNPSPLVFTWRSVISEPPQCHSTKRETNPRSHTLIKGVERAPLDDRNENSVLGKTAMWALLTEVS